MGQTKNRFSFVLKFLIYLIFLNVNFKCHHSFFLQLADALDSARPLNVHAKDFVPSSRQFNDSSISDTQKEYDEEEYVIAEPVKGQPEYLNVSKTLFLSLNIEKFSLEL